MTESLLASLQISLAAVVLWPAVLAGQELAASNSAPAPQPVLVASDTFVRSMKYDSNWVAPGSSGLGAATSAIAYQRPKAIRFLGKHDRTYIVLGDRVCHPAIVFFDHRTRQWSTPRRFGTTEVEDDAHGLPGIALDDRGHVHAIYGAHGTKMYAARSANPEDIGSWTAPVAASHRGTYSTVFFVEDALHLFLRERELGWGFKASRDGGKTWPEMQVACRPFQDPAGVFYPVVWIGQEKPVPKVHMFWLFFYRHRAWEDMYYAVSEDLGKTWWTAAGQLIGKEIKRGEGDLIFKGDTHGWQHQVVVDPSGRPGLLFATGGPDIIDHNDLLFAYWTGQAWRTSKICDLASRYCSGAVVVKGADHYRAYVANGRWNGGEICEFETTDGGRRWKRIRNITKNSPAPNAHPAVVENASSELQIIWCSGDKGKTGGVYAWGEAGTLPKQPNPQIRGAAAAQ
jgi:hypothetical protein